MASLIPRQAEAVCSDAVPHYQFEDIWLLRRGGELSLSERIAL
ncbi:hypothetical protein [Streptomyces sp. NRRL F-5126]|nr:hypothetical protein [Streptomyces sp. NRRL F-5126]